MLTLLSQATAARVNAAVRAGDPPSYSLTETHCACTQARSPCFAPSAGSDHAALAFPDDSIAQLSCVLAPVRDRLIPTTAASFTPTEELRPHHFTGGSSDRQVRFRRR